MRRKQLTPLIFIVLVAVGSLVAVFASDTTPQLGLDLQGGVSVVLQPNRDTDNETLSQTIEIIRSRVDGLGVAEPEITRQGGSVVVQLPGVKNQRRALELVGDTAELRFRPVLGGIPGSIEDLLSSTTTTTAGESTTTTKAGESTTTTKADGSTTTTTAGVEGQSKAGASTPYQDGSSTTTTTVVEDTTTTTTGEPTTGFELTPRDKDVADQPVVLAQRDDDGKIEFTYQLGPTAATGKIIETASRQLGQTGQFSVSLTIKSGDENIGAFNRISTECFNKTQNCPTGQLAIVLDSDVVSAPEIQTPTFERDQIAINGSFTGSEASDLALVLRYGSLPVELEPQTVQTVSPTLGKDSLRAGLFAGFVGLALVCLYMLVYYRALGLVVILGLMIWSALNYSIICWLGASQGLALSLAGVTGLVVSVGVTVDSYVVYFERLKDDVRLGRTLRTTTERSWKRAFRTIIAANVSSLIGAVLLYALTVGPVRGFAFFLGLATGLDVVVAWFFIRPMVALLGRSKFFTEARRFGVARGLGLRGTTASAPAGAGR